MIWPMSIARVSFFVHCCHHPLVTSDVFSFVDYFRIEWTRTLWFRDQFRCVFQRWRQRKKRTQMVFHLNNHKKLKVFHVKLMWMWFWAFVFAHEWREIKFNSSLFGFGFVFISVPLMFLHLWHILWNRSILLIQFSKINLNRPHKPLDVCSIACKFISFMILAVNFIFKKIFYVAVFSCLFRPVVVRCCRVCSHKLRHYFALLLTNFRCLFLLLLAALWPLSKFDDKVVNIFVLKWANAFL